MSRVVATTLLLAQALVSVSAQRCAHSQEYDFVIVGSGPAGSALAYVLSEDPGNKVLLIEEGGYSIPGKVGVQEVWKARDWFGLISNPEIEKGYETVPQPGYNNRVHWQPRAKVTGGCTSHNGMNFIRGSRAAYDEWGNGWSWDVLKPHWQTILDKLHVTTNNGTTGPGANRMDWLLDICTEGGWAVNHEVNTMDGVLKGCSFRQYSGGLDTDQDGNQYLKRDNTWRWVADVMKDRPNLSVMTHTRADQILFQGKRAYGVHATDPLSGTSYELRASKEVIVAAGVYDTPKLLMLSGVGPREHLEDLGIEAQHELPGVGGHLVDDNWCGMVGPLLKEQPPRGWIEEIWPLSGVQLWGRPGDNSETPPSYNLNLLLQNNFFDKDDHPTAQGKISVQVELELLQLHSEGTVRLRSTNPDDKPLIDTKSFSDPRDMANFLEAFKAGRALFETAAVKNITTGPPIKPGPSVDTDEEIEEWVRANCVATDFHPAGTSRMGPDPKKGDVVDGRLRVHGLQGLRVVDASIFPSLTHGNPAQPTMLVGLRGAEMILEDHASSPEV